LPEREDDLREEMLDLVRALKGHIGQGGAAVGTTILF